jgi:hypothetical protein
MEWLDGWMDRLGGLQSRVMGNMSRHFYSGSVLEEYQLISVYNTTIAIK